MNELIAIIVSALAGSLGTILVARLSKSKREKEAGLVEGYIKLVDMTGDQLERKINQITKLDKDLGVVERENRKLKEQMDEMGEIRKEKDELFEALEARVAGLQAQLTQDARDRDELRRKLGELDSRYRALWQYLIALMEHMKKNGVNPLDPPKELQSDPEILRIIGRKP